MELQALGMVETRGLVASIEAADADAESPLTLCWLVLRRSVPDW